MCLAARYKPDDYNQEWWECAKYQGVAPPMARTEADFDPGAKYHVPGNTPYMRYFLSYILQFQFHRSLCKEAGFKGPLDECSIYGNKEAGANSRRCCEGRSAVAGRAGELTGSEMDATAIIEYFAADGLQSRTRDSMRLDITRTNRMGDRS